MNCSLTRENSWVKPLLRKLAEIKGALGDGTGLRMARRMLAAVLAYWMKMRMSSDAM